MKTNLSDIRKLLHVHYTEEEYPALCRQIQSNKTIQPLKGLHVLDATPVFRNTLLKHLALLAAGAELTVGISDVMAHDPQILTLLKDAGIPVVHAGDPGIEFDLILDCAGSFSSWKARNGIVELTRSGAEAYGQTSQPVYWADAGRIKQIETCLGTGESYFRAMKQLGHDQWEGRKLVLFGTGKVGTGIIWYATRLGAEVHAVTDLSTLKPSLRAMLASAVHYTDSTTLVSVLNGAYAVVTATGVRHALSAHCPAEVLLQSGAILANMGVEDEFGPQIPDAAVLCRKQTLNFILEEPTQLKYIDATMALHNEGAFYLCRGCPQKGLITPPVETEEKILKITRENGCIGQELDWI